MVEYAEPTNRLKKFINSTVIKMGNYCVLPEYHKCVLPPLT